ncbi:hypothetical protein Acsp05_29820 [Actinokineospora sp. NBRC 105648]|nr:hypothetical protein Acsp05_29820 [Actinokineospora sp. NBRC 105648]
MVLDCQEPHLAAGVPTWSVAMNTALRPQPSTRPQPRTKPMDDAEYNDLCACRCSRLPGIHPAGQCATRKS